jgi:hypothetical protein
MNKNKETSYIVFWPSGEMIEVYDIIINDIYRLDPYSETYDIEWENKLDVYLSPDHEKQKLINIIDEYLTSDYIKDL